MAKDQLQEHIKRIMSKSGYVLESPSYRAIIDDDFDSYDDPNALVGGPQPMSGTSPLREEDPIPGEEEAMGDLEMDALGGEQPPADPNAQPEMGAEPTPVGGEMTTPSPDELQNDIIKKNIEVMKQLNSKIDDLEMGIDQLNMQNQNLAFKTQEMAKEVEEVREPTNVEKLPWRFLKNSMRY